MIVFDTDAWKASDRVERWREEFGRSVIRAEVVAQGERPQDFGVRMALLGGGRLTSLDMRLRAIRKVRDRSWFGDGADDLTFMLCLSGTVRFETNGERRILRRAEAALFSHVVPVDLAWDRARIVTLQVPRALLETSFNPDRLAGRVLGRDVPARALLQVYLAELWRQGGALTPLAERQLLELLMDGLTGENAARSRPAARVTARIAAVRALIGAHGHEDLRSEEVSRAVGVSVRTLERDLASVGTSFADELAEMRLTLVMAQLGGTERISDIAFAAGFNDLSNFNRHFKRRLGCTPTEVRDALNSRRRLSGI